MTQTFYVKKKRTLFTSKGWKQIGKNIKINETKELNSKRRGNRNQDFQKRTLPTVNCVEIQKPFIETRRRMQIFNFYS